MYFQPRAFPVGLWNWLFQNQQVIIMLHEVIVFLKFFNYNVVNCFIYDYAGMRYNALSFIFLQIRELSWLQWHPFSVSSSPLDGKYHLSVLIKVLGEWTEKLRGNILKISKAESEQELLNPKITASVEGPYGHELPYHLMYVH